MARGDDQDALKAATELLLRKPSGKGKRTSDRLAAEAQEFFRQPRYVPRIPIASATLDPETLYKYQQLLNSLALHPDPVPLLYTDALRSFLRRLRIAWYAPAFERDPTSPGSGQPPSALGPQAAKLRGQGKTWGEIAKLLVPEKHAVNAKAASDQVRGIATRYLNRAAK